MNVSSNALSSVAAVLNRVDDTQQRADFKRMVDACKTLSTHRVRRAPKRFQGLTRLYALTTIAASARYGGTRCVAVYDNFQKGQRAVLRNVGDIWEHSYSLAVLEVVYANVLYAPYREQYWFRWNEKAEGYEPCTTPSYYENIIGISVG